MEKAVMALQIDDKLMMDSLFAGVSERLEAEIKRRLMAVAETVVDEAVAEVSEVLKVTLERERREYDRMDIVKVILDDRRKK